MSKHRSRTVKIAAAVTGLALLVGGALVLFGRFGKPQARAQDVPPNKVRVETVALEPAEPALGRTYPARVQANQTAVLAFRVSGPLVAFPVRAGESVAKGQLLARIDPRDYRSRLAETTASLAEARAKLRAMQAGERSEMVEVLRARLASARARLAEAKMDHDRVVRLHARAVATASELDRSRCAKLTAEADVAEAEQNLKMGRIGSRQEDLEATEAGIRSLQAREALMRAALADTELRAPFAGQVARTYVENHVNVQATSPVLLLQDVREVELLVDVPERVVAGLAAGAFPPARARFDFLPGRVFPVRLKEMETVADAQTQTYRLTLVMAVPQGLRILPGMSGEVQVDPPQASSAGAFRVPARAVRTDRRGGPSVWRMDPRDSVVQRVPVRTGPVSDGTVAVRGNLAAGDRIVTAGAAFLADGMRVQSQ